MPSGTRPGPKLDPNQSSDLHSKGLAAAAAIQRMSVKISTLDARSKAVSELTSWLQTIHASDSKTLANIVPEDLLVYLTQHWLPNHAGSFTADGEAVAAPSSLAGVKSHIATELEVLGRSGEWNPLTKQGNPMHSTQIRNMLKGYSNQAAELGYRKLGAVPLSEDEMCRLLRNMLQQLSTAAGSEQLLLIRDGLLFNLLWQSCFRGFNTGSVRLSNITLPTGESALPYLYPVVKLASKSEVHLIPDSTKNKKGGHCRLTLSCDELCFTSWLQLAIHSYHAAGQPITSTS